MILDIQKYIQTLIKYSSATLLPNFLSSTIADALVKKLICILGSHKLVLTCQGKNFLSNLMRRPEQRWDDSLELATFFYNKNIHEGTRCTLYKLVSGKLARQPSSELLPENEKL